MRYVWRGLYSSDAFFLFPFWIGTPVSMEGIERARHYASSQCYCRSGRCAQAGARMHQKKPLPPVAPYAMRLQPTRFNQVHASTCTAENASPHCCHKGQERSPARTKTAVSIFLRDGLALAALLILVHGCSFGRQWRRIVSSACTAAEKHNASARLGRYCRCYLRVRRCCGACGSLTAPLTAVRNRGVVAAPLPHCCLPS